MIFLATLSLVLSLVLLILVVVRNARDGLDTAAVFVIVALALQVSFPATWLIKIAAGAA